MKKYFKNARKIELDRNEVLHRADEKCVNLGYILSGRLVLKKYLSSGKELYIAEFYPGEMFGELLVLAGEQYKGWLIADEKTEVLELDINSLNKLMSDSSFKKLYFNRISEKVTKMTERIEILSYKRISDRIILYILNHFIVEKEYNINISTLAKELDCSREALSRAISILESEEAILKEGNKLKILDFSLLENQLSFI